MAVPNDVDNIIGVRHSVDIYRFTEDVPFDWTNEEKGKASITPARYIDLADYKENHEVVVSYIRFHGPFRNTKPLIVRHIFINNDTQKQLWKGEWVIPTPESQGYSYWNSYWVKAWIGKCAWELNGPMTLLVVVQLEGDPNITGAVNQYATIVDTSIPPPPEELPDFWTDPIGWVSGVISGGLSALVNWMGSLFHNWADSIRVLFDSFTKEVTQFFRDPVGKIKEWVESTYTWISDITGTITTTIGDWWDSTKKGIWEWMTNTVATVAVWIDQQFKNIGEWWNNTATSVRAWINNAVKYANDWINNWSTTITNWWNNTRTTIGEWWSDSIKAVGDWIDNTTRNIGEWWNNTWTSITETIQGWIVDATSFVTEKFLSFTKWLEELAGTIADYIGEQIKNVQEWVNDVVPGMVEGMFEWAKPVIDPIINVANWLGQLMGIVQGTYPKEDEIIEAEEKHKETQEKVENILEGL